MCVCVCVCVLTGQLCAQEDVPEEHRVSEALPQPNEATRDRLREHLMTQQRGLSHLMATLEEDLLRLAVMVEAYRSGSVFQ